MIPLTEKEVTALTKPSTTWKIYPGRALRYFTANGGSYHVVFYDAGQPRTKKLGGRELKIAKAIALAGSFNVEAVLAAEAKERAAATAKKVIGPTFGEYADEWIERFLKPKKFRKEADMIKRIEVLRGHWGNRPIKTIDSVDIDAMIKAESGRGLGTGSRAQDYLKTLRVMLKDYARAAGKGYNYPVIPGTKADQRPLEERERERVLDDDELRAFWTATADGSVFSNLLRTLLLTGQRWAKVAEMRWADLDGDTWTIATERREKRNSESMKLPPLAMQAIEAQRERTLGNGYVFSTGTSYFQSESAAKKHLGARLKIEPWVIHDLRRTARTLMPRAGVPRDIASRVTGHVVGSRVERIYDRYDYAEEKADALAKLAGLVTRIVGLNVVQLVA